jgi:hypothetical protein
LLFADRLAEIKLANHGVKAKLIDLHLEMLRGSIVSTCIKCDSFIYGRALNIGKKALGRGLALDRYAFPDIGVPPYSPIGPDLDRCVVYSVVRTESAFDQQGVSPAKAVGLMQVTPEAGRDTAKRFGVRYDWTRLVSDHAPSTESLRAETGMAAVGGQALW